MIYTYFIFFIPFHLLYDMIMILSILRRFEIERNRIRQFIFRITFLVHIKIYQYEIHVIYVSFHLIDTDTTILTVKFYWQFQ